MPLTDQGFTPKTLSEVRSDIEENLKIALGSDIDTSPESRIGQFIDTVANEINDTWQGLQDVYNAFFPDTSTGANLDNVVAITNVTRRAATSAQADLYLIGDSGTSVPAGTEFQKTGTDSNFTNLNNETIADTANYILLDADPASGELVLSWDGDSTAPILFDDDESTIKSKIEALTDIDDVTITGTLGTTRGFHILFVTDSLTSREPTVESSTLQDNASNDVNVTAAYASEQAIPIVAVNAGQLTVPSFSITTIVTPVIGLDEVINQEQGISGRDRETDAELRERREQDLQNSQGATAGGMRDAISAISGVDNLTIIENDTSSDDSEGRPPHSFEAYVTGGDDDEVAQAIYDAKPLAITVAQTSPNVRTGEFTDVNGDTFTLDFSEPISVPMAIEVQGQQDTEIEYPDDGDQQIKDALIAFFNEYQLGQDVLNHTLYTPVNTVPGIRTLTILQTKVADAAPSTGNTVIEPQEIATLQDDDIIVNII